MPSTQDRATGEADLLPEGITSATRSAVVFRPF